MTTKPIPHSAPPARRDELHALSVRLYELISSGHDALPYNVDERGIALTAVGADGQRRPVRVGGGFDAPPWQRARELRPDGAEVDRRFNPWVLTSHLRGKYAVAPAAPGWTQWVALDIDAHAAPGASELVSRRLARARADRVLAQVWRALGCSAERHPLVLRSPGGGYHVWFPLTRGATAANAEHTWPALVARAWFERHLMAAGLELGPGVLEVYPAGRSLRAPCGLGMQVLQATRPDDPDALGLTPWPGTMADERVDWRGAREALSIPVRRVAPMVRVFLAQWEAQRRSLADWLGRPEATWDPAWGFLGWRAAPGSPEKIAEGIASEGCVPSQESDDVPGVAGGQWGAQVEAVGRSRSRRSRGPGRGRGSGRTSEESLPVDQAVDAAPDRLGGLGVRGRAFKDKVRALLASGITAPSTRHDAVLTLSFYWAATCGLGDAGALARLEAWCGAHPHVGSRLAGRPRAFRDTCLREARHYIAHHAARWRFRGRGDGGGLATLAPADHAVLEAVDVRVRGEVSAVLAWLAGRADGGGRIDAPIEIASGLLARLCGDRRVDEEGRRRRSSTLAISELERLGILTLAHNYRVGQRGRVWSCWYQFGSGVVPRRESMRAEAWSALASPTPPPGGIASGIASGADGVAPVIEVRVIGERVIPEGTIRVLTDGTRGLARTLVALAEVVAPIASRAPWFVRPFAAHTFTPGGLRTANAATVIPFPDVAARRGMTRRARLAWGGGLGPPRWERTERPWGAPLGPAGLRLPVGELAGVGAVSGAGASLEPAEVLAHAWHPFRRGRDP